VGDKSSSGGVGGGFLSDVRDVKGKAHGAISLPPPLRLRSGQALRKVREGWGTQFRDSARGRLGHPPSCEGWAPRPL
jgi:hypothetical protein